MSDTPRTDAATEIVWLKDSSYPFEIVRPVKIVRTEKMAELERELNEAKAELSRRDAAGVVAPNIAMIAKLASVTKERDQLMECCELNRTAMRQLYEVHFGNVISSLHQQKKADMASESYGYAMSAYNQLKEQTK